MRPVPFPRLAVAFAGVYFPQFLPDHRVEAEGAVDLFRGLAGADLRGNIHLPSAVATGGFQPFADPESLFPAAPGQLPILPGTDVPVYMMLGFRMLYQDDGFHTCLPPMYSSLVRRQESIFLTVPSQGRVSS